LTGLKCDSTRSRMACVEEIVIRIDERLAATLPQLATKAEVADLRTEVLTQLPDKPGRLYMWGVMGAMTTAYTAALAVIGVVCPICRCSTMPREEEAMKTEAQCPGIHHHPSTANAAEDYAQSGNVVTMAVSVNAPRAFPNPGRSMHL
jgi:hypothetical protein